MYCTEHPEQAPIPNWCPYGEIVYIQVSMGSGKIRSTAYGCLPSTALYNDFSIVLLVCMYVLSEAESTVPSQI